MKTSRFTSAQISAILKRAEAGERIGEICRSVGISDTTFGRWRAKYGGLEVSEAQRLTALETENRRLKQLLAETMLDNAALKDVLAKKWYGPLIDAWWWPLSWPTTGGRSGGPAS